MTYYENELYHHGIKGQKWVSGESILSRVTSNGII